MPSSLPSLESPSTTGTDSYVLDFSHGKSFQTRDPTSSTDDMEKKLPARPEATVVNSSETRLYDDPHLDDNLIILTPKQTNVNPLPQIISITSSHSIGTLASGQIKPKEFTTHDDIPNDSDIAWSTKDDSPGFRQVHYRLFETITTWVQQIDTDKHPFHIKWWKAIYKGLQATTSWERVAKILNISCLKYYIDFMNECPPVKERYEFRWDYFDNAVRCKELELPEIDNVNHDIGKLNAFQRQLQNMIVRFDDVF